MTLVEHQFDHVEGDITFVAYRRVTRTRNGFLLFSEYHFEAHWEDRTAHIYMPDSLVENMAGGAEEAFKISLPMLRRDVQRDHVKEQMMKMREDVLDRDMKEWRKKADDIFEALLECLDRNYEDEMQRFQAQKYILHKYVWDMTVDNDRADEVLKLVLKND